MNQGIAYLNGRWIDAADLAIPVDDLGFTRGATVVEALRTFNGQPFRVEDHMARLRRSLEIVGWRAAELASEAKDAVAEFAKRNATAVASGDDWLIGVLLLRGRWTTANPLPCASMAIRCCSPVGPISSKGASSCASPMCDRRRQLLAAGA